MEYLIDLSAPIEPNEGEIAPLKISKTDHKNGGNVFGRRIAFSKKESIISTVVSMFNYITGKKKITSKSFPDNEFINIEIITASTHTGTHLDAPFHFGSKSEGKKALTIDEIPLEWCFGNGVVLDLTHMKPGELIKQNDIENSLNKINYKLKPGDIVLIRTGADKYWGTKSYLFKFPGMGYEATKYIVDQGIKVIGIDAYSFDRPFKNMIGDYYKTNDNSFLFPAHFFGREKTYCHIERLINLDKIPKSTGFKIAAFPVKIKGAGAAWTRVVAICG